jgi:hypothetical protein
MERRGCNVIGRQVIGHVASGMGSGTINGFPHQSLRALQVHVRHITLSFAARFEQIDLYFHR